MIIGSKDQFAIEFRPGATPGTDETSFWLCGERIGTAGEFVTTEDVISLLEGAASFRGKRDNPRLFAMRTQDLVQALDSALFTGDDPELDALAEQEQWGRHVIRLPIAGVKCYSVEGGDTCRLVARRPVGRPPLEASFRRGGLDDVLDAAAERIRQFESERQAHDFGRRGHRIGAGSRSDMTAPGMMEAVCFSLFRRAAGAVAIFELRVRLLADSGVEGTALQRAALSGDLTPLVDAVCSEYHASEEQRVHLKAVASIRNKLFHLELSRATGRIRPLTDQVKEGGIWTVNLNDGSVDEVSKTKTQGGRIYGWMWESATSGAFEAIEAAAEKAAEILQELRDKGLAQDLADHGLDSQPK